MAKRFIHFRSSRCFAIVCVLMQCLCASSVHAQAAPGAAAAAPSTRPALLLIHLPGIGGKLRPDQLFVQGLQQSGLDATFETYDWTGTDSGLTSLLNSNIHKAESAKVAKLIESRYRAAPDVPIILTAHSAGAGIASWALARLPADVSVQTLVLIAPALSPQFDLRPAMKHVSGKVYAFTSVNDIIVLGEGTKLLGTVDHVKIDAAGRVGFALPDGVAEKDYEKLVQFPYDDKWMKAGNIGDHIGALMRPFSRTMIGPLLINGTLPTKAAPTSQPTALQVTPTTHPTTKPADPKNAKP